MQIPSKLLRKIILKELIFVVISCQRVSVTCGNDGWQGIVGFRDKIYAAPFGSDKMLIYDIVSGNVSGVSAASFASGDYHWSGIEVAGDKVSEPTLVGVSRGNTIRANRTERF